MKIMVVGTGYVGLVTGACLADAGAEVYCIDLNQTKVDNLNAGKMPIYEPGLDEIVHRNTAKGRLHFSVSLPDHIDGCDAIFIAVGTPPGEDGSADMQYVLAVAQQIGQHLTDYAVVITKSTVPVGAAEQVRITLAEAMTTRGAAIPFDVASNPEFLKEGAAIKDFMNPDRIVIGVDSERAKSVLDTLYRPFLLNGFPLIYMDIPSAEMTKYAANAMLATRISFMNDIANLCERLGADVNMVRKGIGSDPRIGAKFLYAGVGYGGSCFPKDVKALINTGAQAGYPLQLLEAVEAVNEKQKEVLFHKMQDYFEGQLAGKVVAVWGLAFKPNTDDMREAPSLRLIELLLQAGALVRAHDPVAMPEARHILGDTVTWCKDIYETATDADAIALVTEWNEYRLPDWTAIKNSMKGNVVFDGRNVYGGESLNDMILIKIGFVNKERSTLKKCL